MDNISFLVPTRGRPTNMKRLADSIYEMAKYPDQVELWWYIDNDDKEEVVDMAQFLMEQYPTCSYYCGPRICLSETHNLLLEYTKFNSIYSYLGDDNVVRTLGYDEIVYEEFDKYQDKIILLYGSDLYNKDNATFGFVSSEFIRLNNNRLFDRQYSGDYCDTDLSDVFRQIGRFIVREDLVIEHLHYCINKSSVDSTYNDKNRRCYGQYPPCNIQYELNRPERDAAARRLKEYIDNFHSSNNKICATS